MRYESMTTRARGRGPVRWMIAALLLGGTILIGGCGSSGPATASAVSAGTGSPAGQQVNCAAVDSLRGSLQSLSHTSLSPSAAGTLTTDLKNVQKQLGVLKTQGGGRFSGLSSELTGSVDQITKAAGELTTNPAAAVRDLTTALEGLKGKIKPIIAELDKACPKT